MPGNWEHKNMRQERQFDMYIDIIPFGSDNYAYIIQSGDTVTVVDPGDPTPVDNFLKSKNLPLHYILNTHHHGDHIGGNEFLKTTYTAQIIAPRYDSKRIHNIDIAVCEGDTITIGSEEFEVTETPGHTLGHVIFHNRKNNILFSGDTLFSMGCGRLFEGTPHDMYNSLQKIYKLPDTTQIYCGHEYTLSNAEFCLHIDPDNVHIQNRMNDVKRLKENNQPTLPVTLEVEKETNLFLMAKSLEEFTQLREKKDNF